MNQKRITFSMKVLVFFIFTLSSFSCVMNEEKQSKSKEVLWVYVELETISITDTTDYFYYGQMKKSIIDEINIDENKTGLFTLTNIRFINDDKLLEPYETEKIEDKLVFKIQDIEEIIFYKDDPINLFELEELDEKSKALRSSKN